MIIPENPYISEFLIKSAEVFQIPILKTHALIEHDLSKYNLKLLSEKEAIDYVSQYENLLIYSNSESSLDWINANLKKLQAVGFINLFKNKFKFRELLQSVYPNFYFKKVSYKGLFDLQISELPKEFVIKPAVGFLSLGVHSVYDKTQWHETLEKIKAEIALLDTEYSDSVVNSSDFIIEEMIKGEEFAVDVYFNNVGKPVVLNIFHHPFRDENDVSDRIYLTSAQIIKENLTEVQNILSKIGKQVNLKNFPMHIEFRKRNDGIIIPIEVNPLRFAGWCTTDVAKYAYGINVYEYYFEQKEPDWDYIFSKNDKSICYFSMAEVPSNIDKKQIKSFDYEHFCKNYSNILELRKVDFSCNPVFAVIFGKTDNQNEISNILKLKTADFIEL